MANTTPHILLVEDSRFMATHVAGTLREAHNFHVTIAETSEEAHELLEAYDDIVCIVTNYQLHEKTGVQFAASLTGDSEKSSIPIILLTGKQLEPIAATGLEAGVDEFVYKGDYATGDMDVLANRIDIVIRAHGDAEMAHGYTEHQT